MKTYVRATLLGAAFLTVGACSQQSTVEGRPSQQVEGVPGDVFTVEIDGMPCIIWIDNYDNGGHGRDSHSGITCDWRDR